VKVTYHPAVQRDINEALAYYKGISEDLADDFWNELLEAIEYSRLSPKSSHFADCGLRRKNMVRFPYHFLYEILDGRIRVVVVRHHKRSPSFGLKRKWRC
jgi:toxin ParE1/3/4